MKLHVVGALAFLSMVSSAVAQNTQLITEDTMVKSSDPGIEIFVRNKRPSDMTTFRPERTVVFVHGATNPASTGFDFKFGGMSLDGLHRRTWIRRVSLGSSRLWEVNASEGNG